MATMNPKLIFVLLTAMVLGAPGLSAQAPAGAADPSDTTAMDHEAMDHGAADAAGMDHGSMDGGMMDMGQGGMGMMHMQEMMRMRGSMDGQVMQMMGRGRMDAGMMQMMERGMGVMDTGGPSPESILMMADALGLSEEQRAELEAVQDRYQETSGPMMVELREALEQAEVLLDADAPDLDAYGAALQGAVDELVATQVAMASAALEARAILTEEQRVQLVSGMQMMEGMMDGGMMSGGMMDGGMSH